MAETYPIPVRFTDAELARLDAVSEGMGAKRASVIRMVTVRFLEQYEEHPKAFAALDFRDVFARQDGRTKLNRENRAAYPAHRPQHLELNENEPLPKPKKPGRR